MAAGYMAIKTLVLAMALLGASSVHGSSHGAFCPGKYSASTVISDTFTTVAANGQQTVYVTHTSVDKPTLTLYSDDPNQKISPNDYQIQNGSLTFQQQTCMVLELPEDDVTETFSANGNAALRISGNVTFGEVTLFVNGQGQVWVERPILADELSLGADGNGAINVAGPSTAFAVNLNMNGQGSIFFDGDTYKVLVKSANGNAQATLGEIDETLKIEDTMDGQAQISALGGEDLLVTGELNGNSKIFLTQGKCQVTGNSKANCKTDAEVLTTQSTP